MIHTLDVDTPLKAVDAGDLALATLLAAPHHGDLVVLADGNGADLSNCVRAVWFVFSFHHFQVQ